MMPLLGISKKVHVCRSSVIVIDIIGFVKMGSGREVVDAMDRRPGKEICRPEMRQRGRRCGEDGEGLEAIAITDSKVSKVFNVVRHAVPKKTRPRDQSHGCFQFCAPMQLHLVHQLPTQLSSVY